MFQVLFGLFILLSQVSRVIFSSFVIFFLLVILESRLGAVIQRGGVCVQFQVFGGISLFFMLWFQVGSFFRFVCFQRILVESFIIIVEERYLSQSRLQKVNSVSGQKEFFFVIEKYCIFVFIFIVFWMAVFSSFSQFQFFIQLFRWGFIWKDIESFVVFSELYTFLDITTGGQVVGVISVRRIGRFFGLGVWKFIVKWTYFIRGGYLFYKMIYCRTFLSRVYGGFFFYIG